MKLRSILISLVIFQSWCVKTLAGTLEYWDFNVQQSRLEIVTDDAVKPQAQLIANPTRLVIDLPGIKLQSSTKQQGITSYVKEVRLGQFDTQTTRIVVELAPEYSLRPWEVKVRSLSPNRWFIQLPKFLSLQEYSLPDNQPVAIAVPSAKPYTKTGLVLVIDPGHGGRDPGAIGLRGIQEKYIVLSIALKVAQILEKQGIQVVMTRNSDRFISLQGRVQIAENKNADGFISIHANSLGMNQSAVSGLETYYYSSGERLAQTIQRNILRRLDISDRGVRRARFYVLRKTSMPSVLVEVGFVTGTVDSSKLSNPVYRQQMAEAIASGIVEYFR